VNRSLARLTAGLGVTATALALGPGLAQAAPRAKGTTTVTPSALTASVLQGLTGPAELGAQGAVFGITGNPGSGVIKHVGGIRVAELDPATAATSLTLSNFWIDTQAGTVSALVNDAVRAVVFAVGSDGTLTFTDAASRAVTGSGAITGAVAGVAHVALA
jgi:hypothetical protein